MPSLRGDNLEGLLCAALRRMHAQRLRAATSITSACDVRTIRPVNGIATHGLRTDLEGLNVVFVQWPATACER